MRTTFPSVFFYIKFIVMVGGVLGCFFCFFLFSFDGDRMRMMMFERSQSKTVIVKQRNIQGVLIQIFNFEVVL